MQKGLTGLTLDQMKSLPEKEQEELYKQIKTVRTNFKATNYSAIYGVGSPKLARELGTTQRKAQVLLDAYWQRNWAVKKLSEAQYTKTLKDGTMWLKNPVSGFYYSLRYAKDSFSTLNQGTGVFIFDSWVMRMRRKGVHPQLQYHDEVLLSVPLGQEQQVGEALEGAMREVNETLKINVEIGIDVQYGNSYAEVH